LIAFNESVYQYHVTKVVNLHYHHFGYSRLQFVKYDLATV